MATDPTGDGDASPDAASLEAAGLFELLSDETRVRIVRTLYRHGRRSPAAPCLAFSTLRTEVGTEDSGRFNYHLNRLRGVLVERREAGYALSPLGRRLGPLVAEEEGIGAFPVPTSPA